MNAYLKMIQQEDELVKIIATDWQRLLDGFAYDLVRMPKEVVPLSEAIETIEEFLAEVEADGGSRRSWDFYVRACKDDFLLFTYNEKGINEDYREEERPKNPKRVYIAMRDGSNEEQEMIGYAKESYLEFAERDMKKMLAEFEEEKQQQYRRYKDVQKENIIFDVYKDKGIYPHGYLYSYKDGKNFLRQLTEEEIESEKEWEDKITKKTSDVWDSLPFMKKEDDE